MRDINSEINKFIEAISDLWKDEPLDGDETEAITRLIQSGLDQQNGNLSKYELMVIEHEKQLDRVWEAIGQLQKEMGNVSYKIGPV